MKHIVKLFSFLPALCMMYLIYSFSGQNGVDSAALSNKVSSKIISAADFIFDMQWSESEKTQYAEVIHKPVRKLGHMTEYFLLAICVSLPFYVYGLRGFWLMLIAGGICVGFACLDEFHQSFVAGRGPSKRDVLIDSVGICIGILVVRFLCFLTLLYHKANKRSNNTHKKKHSTYHS